MKTRRQLCSFFCLLVVLPLWSMINTVTALPIKKKPPVKPPLPKANAVTRASFLARMSERVFDSADVDGDGTMDFEETYELALHLYILVNRQAPIKPPTRETVYKLFYLTDRDHSGQINKAEFQELATLLAERALSRVIAFKMATLLGAPLLAEYVVRCWTVKERPWLPNLVARLVPEKYIKTVTSKGFARTVLLLLFISTLGNLVLLLVDVILQLWLARQEAQSGIDDEQLHRTKPWTRK